MKGQMFTYGGIFLSILYLSIMLIRMSAGDSYQRGVVSSDGKLISFVNYADFVLKTFNASIDFISQRAAYDLGNVGGVEGYEIHVWDDSSPSIDTLKQQLINRIMTNLPQSTTQGDRTIIWGDATISVSECSTTKCFLVSGGKSISIYEKAIDSRISLNPFKINSKIDSNYFRLLNAGRFVAGRPISDFQSTASYSTFLSDFRSSFQGLSVTQQKDGDYAVFTIEDKTCLPNEYYCIAPLKPGETGIINPMDGKLIPYDWLKLKFKLKVENPITPPACVPSSPAVATSPSSQSGLAGSTLTYTVKVDNNDNSACDSSIFALSITTCPSGWTCTLSKSTATIPPASSGSTTISVTSPTGTASGTYEFKVKATSSEGTSYFGEDSSDYIVSPTPVCSADFSTAISATQAGTCTVSADFTPSNCDSKTWQIKDKSTHAVVCGKALPDNSCQWTVSSGASGTDYSYDLYIGGAFIGTETVTCDASAPSCPNGNCDSGETCSSCPQDCGDCCGNGLCDNGEACSSCSSDCGSCCGNGNCDNEETCSSCPSDCGSCPPPQQYCGDGSCNNGETCSSCPSDCGVCPGCTLDSQCNDFNPCTTDKCISPFCTHSPVVCTGTKSDVGPNICESGKVYSQTRSCSKVCTSSGSCDCTFPSTYTKTLLHTCVFVCKPGPIVNGVQQASSDCWGGIVCGQATISCQNCPPPFGKCGDNSITNDKCYSEAGGPHPIPTGGILQIKCSCSYVNSYSTIFFNPYADCSACTGDCSGAFGGTRECGCGGANLCGSPGAPKPGCWQVGCVVSDTCKYS